MATVDLKQVQKTYDGTTLVVRDFNLEVDDGEFIVLVGPSGCGKSTTLRMVAGLEDVSGGTIKIGDRVVNDVPPKDRDIAMVFQSYALYPHMTVRENMGFSLKLRKRSKADIEKKVLEAAKVLDIEHLLDRKPKALSGGQRQRVAVGRAIVRDPSCFLFDEPLSNLDAKLRVEMRAELKQLHQRLASTTLYVTHDQEEAMTLGDRVVVMKDGLILQVGSALQIYHQPTNRFVAGFLGSPPMNFFEGTVREEAGKLVFDDETSELTWSSRSWNGRACWTSGGPARRPRQVRALTASTSATTRKIRTAPSRGCGGAISARPSASIGAITTIRSWTSCCTQPGSPSIPRSSRSGWAKLTPRRLTRRRAFGSCTTWPRGRCTPG
jgi:multiple sugar transport system ATP-binding protein